jgi:predicted amidohydrolase
MPSTIRVSAIQLPAVVEGRSFKARQARNLEIIAEMLEDAGKRGSDIALLGEYANLHHRSVSPKKRDYVSDPIPGKFTDTVAAVAKKYRMHVALPMFGTYRGVLSSWVVFIDREGKISGCYAKSHPIIQEQHFGIKAGDDLPVFKLDCCNVGVMTCMDIEYPEVAQVLMLRGADILLFPHVQSSWGEVDWEIRYRARAVDTGLFVVSACYGYPEGTWMPGKMVGRSSVIGRDGMILGDLGRKVGVLTMDLDLHVGRVTHFFFEKAYERTAAVKASRRPELYTDLTNQRLRDEALERLQKNKK